MREVTVVIPVYTSLPSATEQHSFRQCLQILGNHPIVLIAPQELDLSAYLNIRDDLQVMRFDEGYFRNLCGYNRLMLSPDFYRRFIDSRYILLYQLDAFVFSDQLFKWCSKGYDYIGAPWIDLDWADNWAGVYSSLALRLLPGLRRPKNGWVGNGGLSLRKVSSFIRCLRIWRYKAAHWTQNEDQFWAFYIPSYNPFFRIPKTQEALQFAFDFSPSKCFELNQNRLPFGCHAWHKNEIDFWRPIFSEHGCNI